MTITTQKPLADVDATYRRAIKALNEQDIKNRVELLNSGLHALPIFALTLEDVKKGQFPANNSGWLLVPTGQAEKVPPSQPALVEVATSGEANAKPRFASFSQGEGAKAFYPKLVKVLEQEFAGQGLELRFLRIPAMLVTAFWIASSTGGTKGGKNDRIVVVRSPSILSTEQQYQPPAFFAALLPLVEKFRGFTREKA